MKSYPSVPSLSWETGANVTLAIIAAMMWGAAQRCPMTFFQVRTGARRGEMLLRSLAAIAIVVPAFAALLVAALPHGLARRKLALFGGGPCGWPTERC
jgi:hypothetical protein